MSTASSIVSFRGDDEVDFDDAVDELFKEIQQNFNSIHSTIRHLAQAEDRNDTFQERCDTHFRIIDYVETVNESFKELDGVSKQVVGKPVGLEEKKYLKDLIEKRKQDKIKAKEDAKLAKATAKLEIK